MMPAILWWLQGGSAGLWIVNDESLGRLVVKTGLELGRIQLGFELGKRKGKVAEVGIEPRPMEPVSLKLTCFGRGR